MATDLTWVIVLSSLAAVVIVAYGSIITFRAFKNRNISSKHSLYYDDAGLGTGSTLYHTDSVWEHDDNIGEEEAFVNDNHSADGIIDKSLSFTKYGSLRMP